MTRKDLILLAMKSAASQFEDPGSSDWVIGMSAEDLELLRMMKASFLRKAQYFEQLKK